MLPSPQILSSIEEALFRAINGNDLAAVEKILDGPVEIDLEMGRWFGRTYLTQASSIASADLVALLIHHGAPVDQVDDEDDWPLLMAVDAGAVTTMRVLLNNGAQVDLKTDRGLDLLRVVEEKGGACAELLGRFLSQKQQHALDQATPGAASPVKTKRL